MTRHRERIPKVCFVCHAEFTVPYCFRHQRACSASCGAVLRLKPKKIRSCLSCHKTFSVRPSDPKVYCSRKCMYVRVRGSNHPHWVPPQTNSCDNCGEKFSAKKKWERKKRFCGTKCQRVWFKLYPGPRSSPIGSVRQDEQGYRYVKRARGLWVPEHRIVAEKMLDRKLKSTERVHHKNGQPSDNREINLQVVTNSEHASIHYLAERIGLSVMASEAWTPSIEGMAC